MKYTPGPWTVINGSDGDFIIKAIGSIATVEGGYGDGKVNARLIAAAPDMLAIIPKLLQALNVAIDRSEGDTFGIHHNDVMDAMAEARQVIAKAEGLDK